MSSLPEIIVARAARQFRFNWADSTFLLEFNPAKGCWQGRWEEESSAELVPWSWINQAWFIRPDNGEWATLETSDESLVNALDFLAFTALPHWENPTWQNYCERTRRQWSDNGANRLRYVSNKVYGVILRICLEHRVLNGCSTLWNLSSLGVIKVGVVLRGMVGLSAMYPNDPYWHRCSNAVECLSFWLHKKLTEEWPQVWNQRDVLSRVQDELASVADAMHLVEENARRYLGRIFKILIRTAFIPMHDLLDTIFSFLEVEEVNR